MRDIRTVEACASIALWASACAHHAIPPDAVANLQAGVAYLRQGQCELAEERCAMALEYGDRFPEAHNCLGIAALECGGRIEEAKEHFEHALSIDADFAQAHNNLGTCMLRKTPPDDEAACDEFKAAIEIDPTYGDARENYASCLVRRGRVAGDLGRSEERAAQFREARKHLIRLLEREPNRFRGHTYLGFMALLDRNYAEAEERFHRCLEIDPKSAICRLDLGNTYLETARYKEALRELAEAIAAARDGEDRDGTALAARRNMAVAWDLCAKSDHAVIAVLELLKKDPGNPESHAELARIYADLGLMDEAAREWRVAAKLAPSFCPAWFAIALHADRILDSGETVAACHRYLECRISEPGEPGEPRGSDARFPAAGDSRSPHAAEIGRCRELIRILAARDTETN